MALLDQYGRPTTSRHYAHAADRSRFRGPDFSFQDRSIEELIPSYDRKTLVSVSKRLFQNMGAPMRSAILQKAEYSVGTAWLPTYGGTDQEAGEDVMSWMANVFYPLADVRGGAHNWHNLLEQSSIAMDRDGEAFVLLTTSKDGNFPRVQQIPSYMVSSDSCDNSPSSETGKNGGKYRGLKLNDGVVYNEQGAAVAYRVEYSKGRKDAEYISARSMIHVLDLTYQDQGRGLPAFSHCLDDLKSMLQSTEYELIRQQVISSILLVENNETGGPDIDDPAFDLSVDSNGEGVASEQVGPGYRYFKSESGSGLSVVKHENPGPVWESFQDRLTRSAVSGVWAYGLIWKAAGQGTAERVDVVRARKFVEKRQKQLKHLATRIVSYAAAFAAEKGRVPMLGNLLKIGFTVPPRLTIDDGRELKGLIEGKRAGIVSDETIQGFQGNTPIDHYRTVARLAAQKELARQEAESEFGVKIDPREMGLVTPNEPAPTDEENEQESEDDS